MKKLMSFVLPVMLGLGAGAVQADDDVRLDEAVRLVQDGTIQSFDTLNQKALAVRAGQITDSELEREQGRYVYKLEIRDDQGGEWDLDLDATSGEILRNQRDE
ncbi:PepSY domain-containing protein [Pseudomonas sp.]|jgi:uncharacterized membrane protein YkoI|uniref:PepSY domain-containing protein n=1 Tax=Pseudomonas sp. TaxID=306 RepID=UPI00272CDD5C|nr:PepSY domain-containing protein [Pseudomonas sp.]